MVFYVSSPVINLKKTFEFIIQKYTISTSTVLPVLYKSTCHLSYDPHSYECNLLIILRTHKGPVAS